MTTSENADSKTPTGDESMNLRIGRVHASLLNYEQIRDIQGQNERWMPADGRSCLGTKYYKLTGRSNVPDLRGVFLRGICDSETPLDQRDPEGPRPPGSIQKQAIQNHQHAIHQGYTGENRPYHVQRYGLSYVLGSSVNPGYTNSENDPGKETRPINGAVYFYIEVN